MYNREEEYYLRNFYISKKYNEELISIKTLKRIEKIENIIKIIK
jgi:hypothetical protein